MTLEECMILECMKKNGRGSRRDDDESDRQIGTSYYQQGCCLQRRCHSSSWTRCKMNISRTSTSSNYTFVTSNDSNTQRQTDAWIGRRVTNIKKGSRILALRVMMITLLICLIHESTATATILEQSISSTTNQTGSSVTSTMPTLPPGDAPTVMPSLLSTSPSSPPSFHLPTFQPSVIPTEENSLSPTISLSQNPSFTPTKIKVDSQNPSNEPITSISQPSHAPTMTYSNKPSSTISSTPSIHHSTTPSLIKSNPPSLDNVPTLLPSSTPTIEKNTHQPTISSTEHPSSTPTNVSSDRPSIVIIPITNNNDIVHETEGPSYTPTVIHSNNPSTVPSSTPTIIHSNQPSYSPTILKSNIPSITISTQPSSSSKRTTNPILGQTYEYLINAEMNVEGPNQILSQETIESWEELTTNFLLQKILANNHLYDSPIDEVNLIGVSLDRQFDLTNDRRFLIHHRINDNDHDDDNGGNRNTIEEEKGNLRRSERIGNDIMYDERRMQFIEPKSELEYQQSKHSSSHGLHKQKPNIKNVSKGILLLQFTISFAFTTPTKDTPMDKERVKTFINDAFDSNHDKSLYISLMKQQQSSSSTPEEARRQLSSFDTISVEVTNVHQSWPKFETLSSSNTTRAIITGMTIGASVFVICLMFLYLRWKKLWPFSLKDDYIGGHIPLADQNSSLPSRQSSLPSIPISITTTMKKKTKKVGGDDKSNINVDESRILQPAGSNQNDEELGFVERDSTSLHADSAATTWQHSQQATKTQSNFSLEYSSSDHGSLSHDINIHRQQNPTSLKESKQGMLSPFSSSKLTTIENDNFFSFRNEQIKGRNPFRSPNPTKPKSNLKKQSDPTEVHGEVSFSTTPFDLASPDQGESDTAARFFKDSYTMPVPKSSSSSSSGKSPPFGQMTRRVRPVTVISGGSSRNSSSATSAPSVGVEELIMNSPGQVSLFSDDDSGMEKLGKMEIVEVTVPPGVLGLVIDTVHGGIPTVFSIKEDSVIADKVQEGDRLISVNGVDTTELSARNVSKIITRFKDSERNMIFFRQKPNNENE